jgi:hypothetical protein
MARLLEGHWPKSLSPSLPRPRFPFPFRNHDPLAATVAEVLFHTLQITPRNRRNDLLVILIVVIKNFTPETLWQMMREMETTNTLILFQFLYLLLYPLLRLPLHLHMLSTHPLKISLPFDRHGNTALKVRILSKCPTKNDCF